MVQTEALSAPLLSALLLRCDNPQSFTVCTGCFCLRDYNCILSVTVFVCHDKDNFFKQKNRHYYILGTTNTDILKRGMFKKNKPPHHHGISKGLWSWLFVLIA